MCIRDPGLSVPEEVINKCLKDKVIEYPEGVQYCKRILGLKLFKRKNAFGILQIRQIYLHKHLIVINCISSAGKEVVESLSYSQKRRKKNAQNIEDIYDGAIYKEHFDADGFLDGTPPSRKKKEKHISLQINTDGVSLFK